MASNPIELRTRFKAYAGDERYSKFVADIHRFAEYRGRLRHWQEKLWSRFLTDNPDYQMAHADLCAAFRVCELHDCELESRTVPVVDGCVDFSREYEADMIELFPHATRDFVSTEGAPKKASHELMWYCKECDNVRETTRWRIGN